MNGEWCYFKSHFTPSQCDSIIEEALKIPAFDSVVGVEKRSDGDWRRSKIRPILKSPAWNYLFEEIDKLVYQANKEWFGVDYSYLPGIQFATYDSTDQGCYKRHQDVFFLSPKQTHRKLSVTVQLTDPSTYVGGELKFLDVGVHPKEENMRLQGTVCVFPSLIFHEVTPVTAGVRHSLAAWYEGPRWR